MKITVLYNTNTSTANDPLLKLADDDTIATANAVAENLSSLGHQVDTFDVTEDSFKDLLYIDTDFYFNCAEGVGNIPRSFIDVAEELEKVDVPFSGSSAFALALTTEKARVKELLKKKGFGTGNYFVFDGDFQNIPPIDYPVIVKPSTEDSSVGIDASSVVYSKLELVSKLHDVYKKYEDPILVEEYLTGREFAVTVFGNGRTAKTFPIYEINYDNFNTSQPKIYDYKAKWDVTSKEYENIFVTCPAEVPEGLKTKIEETAISAFQLTKCSDYARVDIRLSKEDEPYILEINANPGIGPNDEAISSAKAQGVSYQGFLDLIIKSTLKRFYNASYEKHLPLYNLA